MAITGTLETFGLSLSGSWKWTAIVRALDGRLFCTPRNATDILIIDPATFTATRSAMGATLTGSDKWIGAALADDGKIYCAPYSSSDILIIDPATNTATRSAMGASLSGPYKWQGAVLGIDGKVYCAPWLADDILIINPATGTATRSNMGVDIAGEAYGGGSGRWHGCCAAGNGLLYFSPVDAAYILIVNPATGDATKSKLGATIPSLGVKWAGMAVGGDGRIYCLPFDATDILIIDPFTPSGVTVGGVDAGTATRSTMGATLSGSGKWDGVGVSYGGVVVGTPWNATDLLVIDTTTGVAYRDDFDMTLTGTQKVHEGFALGLDGKLYSSPFDQASVIVLDLGEDISIDTHSPRVPPAIFLADPIDPRTFEYRSILRGVDPVEGAALEALMVRRGTGSSARDQGNDFWRIKRIDENLERTLREDIKWAWRRFIEAGQIELVSVAVRSQGDSAQLDISFRNLVRPPKTGDGVKSFSLPLLALQPTKGYI